MIGDPTDLEVWDKKKDLFNCKIMPINVFVGDSGGRTRLIFKSLSNSISLTSNSMIDDCLPFSITWPFSYYLYHSTHNYTSQVKPTIAIKTIS